MSFEYLFSLSVHFQDERLNEEQLQYELLADTIFTGVTVLDVGRSGDVVRIVFDTNLSGPQQTAMNNIVAAHTAIDETLNNRTLANIIPRTSKYNHTVFTRCGSLIYQGAIKARPITSVQIVSYMDDGVTSYSFRVLDVTNGKLITSGTFTNTVEAMCTMSSISNLPFKKAHLEFQVMKTGGNSSKQMYIDSITIFT